MDKAGRIVIPKEVRERIGADETTRFDLDLVLDRIELTLKESERPKPRVVEKDGVWVVTGTGKPAMSIVEAIRQDRDDRTEHLLGVNAEK
ncbi:MAG: hypothetical protein WA771_09600 [Chthoniobacterales bacterium]